MKKIIEFEIPFPTYKTKKSTQLLSLNVANRLNHFIKTQIKNRFKMECGLFIPKAKKTYDSLIIEATTIRNINKKFDAINTSLPIKWVEDVLIEKGYIKDDDKNKIIINPTKLGVKNTYKTTLNIKVYTT